MSDQDKPFVWPRDWTPKVPLSLAPGSINVFDNEGNQARVGPSAPGVPSLWDMAAWQASLTEMENTMTAPIANALIDVAHLNDMRLRYQGIAYALGVFAATHHSSGPVLQELLDSMGLTVDVLAAAGAEEEDLDALREGLRE